MYKHVRNETSYVSAVYFFSFGSADILELQQWQGKYSSSTVVTLFSSSKCSQLVQKKQEMTSQLWVTNNNESINEELLRPNKRSTAGRISVETSIAPAFTKEFFLELYVIYDWYFLLSRSYHFFINSYICLFPSCWTIHGGRLLSNPLFLFQNHSETSNRFSLV